MKPQYRPDIDGLRAIAVLAVVFYHAGFGAFPGGYVGVDVFFVISGYLITKIILKEVQTETFSIARFYERRIRRIFPALVVLAVCVLAAGALLFIPSDFKNLGQSTVALALFASNLFHWQDADYFGIVAEHKPLLHTWSLAVEEQFYFIFPLVLIAIRRFLRARYLLWLSLLAAVSLGVSVYQVEVDAASAFYLVHTRAWELLLGSLIALEVAPAAPPLLRNLLALLGLGLIVASVLLFSKSTPFPGLAALPPVVGAALVIYAGLGGATVVGRLLSLKPLVFVGLISYSLYLWHWPLLVFAKYVALGPLTTQQIGLLLLLMLVCAALSWRFVEQPFRSQRPLLGRSHIFALAGASTVVVLGLGAMISSASGFPQRFDSALLLEEQQSTPRWGKADPWSKCEYFKKELGPSDALCRIGAADVAPSFIVWGDSHAMAIASGIDASAASRGVGGYIVTSRACAPLLGIEWEDREPDCVKFNDAVLRYVEARPELTTIILAARWALSAEGRPYQDESGDLVTLVDLWSPEPGVATNATLFDAGLERTVQKLRETGRQVVLVSQVPEVGIQVPVAAIHAYRTGVDVNRRIGPKVSDYLRRNEVVMKSFEELRGQGQVRVVDVSAKLCEREQCLVSIGGNTLYRDSNHLSIYGALYVADIFDPVFDQVLVQGQN